MNTIKQIEVEPYEDMTREELIECCHAHDAHHAEHHKNQTSAERALQRIASGEDWFDIDGDYPAPKDGTFVILYGYFEETYGQKNDNPHEFRIGKWNPNFEEWKDNWGVGGFPATHWKHIDGEKHIEMLMERETQTMPDKLDFKGAEKATQDWIKCTALSPNQKQVWDAFNKALPDILTALRLADRLQREPLMARNQEHECKTIRAALSRPPLDWEGVARVICRAGICGPKDHLDEQENAHWRRFEVEAKAVIGHLKKII